MRWGMLVAKHYEGNGYWYCDCDCGGHAIVHGDRLPVNGKKRAQKSCGCLKKSRLIKNIHYFENIDTEEKAYFVGLLSADGTITDDVENGTYSIKLVLQSQDKHILEKLKDEVQTEAQVKDSYSTSKLPQGGTCTSWSSSLLLCSKEMVRDIERYGVVPAKSLILEVKYDLIPKELWIHVIRGLIDGDGTFGIFGKKKILELSITTSEAMAKRTKEILEELVPEIKAGIYNAKGCTEKTKRLISTTQSKTLELLDLMYKDAHIYLERKYQNYLTIKKFCNCNDYP